MAQTGNTTIQLYSSSTAAAAPAAPNLAAGELALNTTDEKLYFKNTGGVVKVLVDGLATPLRVANNLSDLASAPTARTNLGVALGVDVQAYDVGTAKTNVAQTFTAPQRTNETTDNDGSFDLSAALDFKCTPSAPFTLTFTNIPTTPLVQKGTVILVNTGGYAVSAHANTKLGASTLATISAAGTYQLAYRTSNGLAYVTASGVLS